MNDGPARRFPLIEVNAVVVRANLAVRVQQERARVQIEIVAGVKPRIPAHADRYLGKPGVQRRLLTFL